MRCIFCNSILQTVIVKVVIIFSGLYISDSAITGINRELSAIWFLGEDMIWGIKLYLMRRTVCYFAYLICSL